MGKQGKIKTCITKPHREGKAHKIIISKDYVVT